MPNIFIIHGAFGNPEENWFPWLKKELGKLGHEIFIPKFPTPDNQTLENWEKVFQEYKKYLDENSIVIGHSLGVVFLLRVLERESKPIKAAFFVSGFTDLLNNPTFDEINQTFIEKNFNWLKIKNNCNKFYVFHSDNDPYVPLSQAKKLSKKLDTNLNLVKNAGHFNKGSGYSEFSLLLAQIKEIS